MTYYFIVELKTDITQPYYSPDYVVLEGEEKKKHYPVSLLRDFGYIRSIQMNIK
jgi:hypothetical protein